MISIGEKIKAWVEGVPFTEETKTQVETLARMPIVGPHIAVMPDAQYEAHGATVGTVIPTIGAIIPAAVGVDIGCGIDAMKTTLNLATVPDDLKPLLSKIESRVPVGPRQHEEASDTTMEMFLPFVKDYHNLIKKHPKIDGPKIVEQLGTLGGGNHFIELSMDGEGDVWILVHSGSRGIGNRIGNYFITLAKERMYRLGLTSTAEIPLPDLAYLKDGEPEFKDYLRAVRFAQEYAALNRRRIVDQVVIAMRQSDLVFDTGGTYISCHHNYVVKEKHFGKELWITRKGAVRAEKDERAVIPGSMGGPSYIVTGRGNPDSFCSAAHGAGRALSRREAKERISLEEHERATEYITCRKDMGVIDESPGAYKDIFSVMKAQQDLVEKHVELHPVLVVKG